jgi:cell fate regulator YaaT (PSP1 superfamily)
VLTDLVEVRFKGNRKAFVTAEAPLSLTTGDPIVVALERGQDLGRVSAVGDGAQRKCGVGCASCGPEGDPDILGSAVRVATTDDVHVSNELRKAEEDIRRTVRERVKKHKLSMKVSDAEWQWDRNKLTIYFTAENRVDFRQLVRELASLFRTRIELRQIGARDEAKRLTGVGRCGREYCCSSWLPELRPVSLSLAKDQRLSLNPSQISGGCGRLLCCLRYEHDFYVASRKRFPKEGKIVTTSVGQERVQAVDIFRDRVLLRSEENEFRSLTLTDMRAEVQTHTEPTVAQPPSALTTFDEEEKPIDAEQAQDAVVPPARRRRRRGGRGSRRRLRDDADDKPSEPPGE